MLENATVIGDIWRGLFEALWVAAVGAYVGAVPNDATLCGSTALTLCFGPGIMKYTTVGPSRFGPLQSIPTSQYMTNSPPKMEFPCKIAVIFSTM